MTTLLRPALLALAVSVLAAGAARADCESDMLQLEAAMKAPNQTPEIKAAYEAGAAKAASAMRKDDDGTCHKAIADALAKSGKVLK
jgi:hypothetical protein